MIGTILLFLIVLSVLVLVHECGHYFTAKWMGMKVEEFGLGFPPRAWSWKGKDGMKWSLNWIPIGGFVKIKGESGEDRKDKDSFAHKPIPARLLVLSAGVIMNFVLAAVLFGIGFAIGIPSVIEGDIGKAAIVRDEAISVTEVLADSPADQAGVKPGDELLSINGQSFESSEAARDALTPSADAQAFDVIVRRGDEELGFMLTPQYYEEYERELVGVGLLETGTVRYPWYLIPTKGIETTFLYTQNILIAFGSIIGNLAQGEKAGVDVSGPVGIAVLTGEVVDMGYVYLLQFAAILSINLGIINILPFPALDGGRIFFVLIEAIRRKPNNQTVEAIVHNVGFALLMVLVIIVTYQDILNLFKG